MANAAFILSSHSRSLIDDERAFGVEHFAPLNSRELDAMRLPGDNFLGANWIDIAARGLTASPVAMTSPAVGTHVVAAPAAINSAPSLTDVSLSLTFDENVVNATPQLLDGDVTFTDAEGNFDGGSVTVTGLLAEDIIAIRNEGTGAGEIGVSGSNVT